MAPHRTLSILALLFLATILAASLHVPSFRFVYATGPDFTISANPTSVVVNPGPQGNSTITLTSQNFAGRVNMTTIASKPGLYCQLTYTSLNLTSNGSNSTTLHCDGFSGTFTVTVVANTTISANHISHQVQVNYVVTDFSITASPTTISASPGKSASSTVTVSSQYPFSQDINFTLTTPQSLNASISPGLLSGPGTATLEVNSTTIGVYNMTILAISGSIHHNISVIVTIANPPPPHSSTSALIFGLRPLTFYTVVAVLLAIALIGAGLLLRRSRSRLKSQKPSSEKTSKGPVAA